MYELVKSYLKWDKDEEEDETKTMVEPSKVSDCPFASSKVVSTDSVGASPATGDKKASEAAS